MSRGMHQFQRTASVRGLARSSDMDAYCYYVAGIVGETLTELFCAYSPAIRRHYAALYALAPSFGQGLQMTNILKDVWEDRSRGACWLPQEVFSRYGVDLAQLSPQRSDARFHAGMLELIGIAHRHLRNALAFTLLIPGEEAGIRLFCLWALGLAALTLRKIQTTPGFTAGAQVKVSRSAVMMTRTLTTVSVRNDRVLQQLFERAARGLPLADAPVPAKPVIGARAGARMTSAPRRASADHCRDRGHAGKRPSGVPSIRLPSGPCHWPTRTTARPACSSGSDLAIAAARDALIGLQARRRPLALRAGGRLHHSGRIHPDDAFPG